MCLKIKKTTIINNIFYITYMLYWIEQFTYSLSLSLLLLQCTDYSFLVGNSDALSRHTRQVEGLDENTPLDDMDDQPQEGFFNRAAKFVMELLQRFLKWVNQPDNN